MLPGTSLRPVGTGRRATQQSGRSRDIGRIARAAAREYREQLHARGVLDGGADAQTVRALPKLSKSKLAPGLASVPMVRPERFTASVWATLGRFAVWTRLLLVFRLGVVFDRLRGRDSLDRRAERLLVLFRRAAGTFIKIGQQLSMRVDMLPYEYCRELGKLTDAVDPLPLEVAIGTIERTTQRPLHELFAAFDPEPIGSASIACVYQAILHNGHKVAVKVRRPDIGCLFAADLRAARWLVSLLEFTSLLRSGNLDNFVDEFEDSIMEELDFTVEGYHQTIFRRQARKAPFAKDFIDAPEVYYDLSNREVLVQEFVSGMWMWEILAAVEQGEPVALSRMRELGIDPHTVAKRLLFVSMWGMLLSDIYHADPHPANIVVQSDGRLVFVDFGACGSTNRVNKDMSRDLIYYQIHKDVHGMVKTMLAAMEPLPHIDVDQFTKEVEIQVYKNVRKVWSKRAPWYDKTSAANWLVMFAILQRYNLPANLDTVRMFRAQMLYDTLAVRVYPPLDTLKTMRQFFKETQKASAKRARRALERRLSKGLVTGAEIEALGELGGMMSRGMQSLRRMIDAPRVHFGALIEKSVSTVLEVGRLVVLVASGTGIWWLGSILLRMARGLPPQPATTLGTLVSSTPYLVVTGLLTILSIRRLLFRLRDRSVD